MTMPRNLILVRHGESEGNVAIQASKRGDESHYTDEFMTTPDHHWHITDKGIAQAACVGEYLAENHAFDKHYVSSYIRTRETASAMNLPTVGWGWRENRGLRERDWGDIGALPKSVFDTDPLLARNALRRKIDPLYWTPPNGESIADLAENRVRNVLETLHREADGDVLAVTHGETMQAFRLVIERLSDAEFVSMSDDKSQTIKNCEVIHYTRFDRSRNTMGLHDTLTWRRRSRPILTDTGWVMEHDEWERFNTSLLSNNDLVRPSNPPAIALTKSPTSNSF